MEEEGAAKVKALEEQLSSLSSQLQHTQADLTTAQQHNTTLETQLQDAQVKPPPPLPLFVSPPQ